MNITEAGQEKLEFRGMEAPTLEQLEEELRREQNKNSIKRLVRNTVFLLLVVAAATVLIAVLVLPVVRIEGTSMENTLKDGELVLVKSGSGYRTGDIIAFHYGSEILVKRVVALPGDRVEMDETGNVYINGWRLEEDYVKEKDMGKCSITFPYQVPAGEVFVLGDNRPVSVDSRSDRMGSISRDLVIGKVVVRLWPVGKI